MTERLGIFDSLIFIGSFLHKHVQITASCSAYGYFVKSDIFV
jgi:hypothetical protein